MSFVLMSNVHALHTIDHRDEELIEGQKKEVFISILHFNIGTLLYKSTSVPSHEAIPVGPLVEISENSFKLRRLSGSFMG